MPRGGPALEHACDGPHVLNWAAVWLSLALVALKASYFGLPIVSRQAKYLHSLAAISYSDVLFVAAAWACARAILAFAGNRPAVARVVSWSFVGLSALACMYVLASVVAFAVLGGFLTYPLLQLMGNLRMLRSSMAVYVTPRIAIALVSVPLAYLSLVWLTVRWAPARKTVSWWRVGIAGAGAAVWVVAGHHAYATDWVSHYDSRIAENPPWVLASSWWQAASREPIVPLAGRVLDDDLRDFEPAGARTVPIAPAVVAGTSEPNSRGRSAAPRRTPNVILIILESVAARWTSVSGGLYDSTPNLKAESSRAIVFDNFYAIVGRSSNALATLLLSEYPKLDFRDFTEEYPDATTTSLASVFRDRGYRTAFVTPSDMRWAGWDSFVRTRGFDEVRDDRSIPCSAPVSSWGLEDRCLVDDVIQFIERDPTRPFFVMGWSQQTHHPYEPTPGVPFLNLRREPVPDDYELGRYLNVLHETDRHLGRLFDAIRRAGLADDTLVVVVGDHGQAFGYPHNTYLQGRTLYEEDVHVPLLIWFPRMYQSGMHSPTVGSQVDLAPTIADLAGVASAPDWRGRSLFDTARVPRAYFYVAQDEFKLGVREERWKYILDLRTGVDELYDLDQDPTEQRNVAKLQPERSARLSRRLAAWVEANRRRYEPSLNRKGG